VQEQEERWMTQIRRSTWERRKESGGLSEVDPMVAVAAVLEVDTERAEYLQRWTRLLLQSQFAVSVPFSRLLLPQSLATRAGDIRLLNS
jgi:hypothetical protein